MRKSSSAAKECPNTVYSHFLPNRFCRILRNSIYQELGLLPIRHKGQGQSSAHVPFPHCTHHSHMRIAQLGPFVLIHDPFRLDHTPSDRVGSVSEIALSARIYTSASTDE